MTLHIASLSCRRSAAHRFPRIVALPQSVLAVASFAHRRENVRCRLGPRLENQKRAEEAQMADRKTKERKLIAFMVKDLGIADTSEPEMVQMEGEVRGLPEEELDKILAE